MRPNSPSSLDASPTSRSPEATAQHVRLLFPSTLQKSREASYDSALLPYTSTTSSLPLLLAITLPERRPSFEALRSTAQAVSCLASSQLFSQLGNDDATVASGKHGRQLELYVNSRTGIIKLSNGLL